MNKRDALLRSYFFSIRLRFFKFIFTFLLFFRILTDLHPGFQLMISGLFFTQTLIHVPTRAFTQIPS